MLHPAPTPTALQVSAALLIIGLLRCGSGAFVILYSSCTLWVALISFMATSKRLAVQQWAGVCLVTGGLISYVPRRGARSLCRFTVSLSVPNIINVTNCVLHPSWPGVYTLCAPHWPPC